MLVLRLNLQAGLLSLVAEGLDDEDCGMLARTSVGSLDELPGAARELLERALPRLRSRANVEVARRWLGR